VRNYEQALNLILVLSRDMAKLDKTRKEYLRGGLGANDMSDKLDRLDKEFKQLGNDRMEVLRDLVLFPPHHFHYSALLDQFSQQLKDNPYQRRVFIMTKYPDRNDANLDAQLEIVIATVKAAVTAAGYHPQLAGETKLHPNLWENIVCQMLACGRGIAIVENRFNPKLNPNVAMEWGWMRAMEKPVLYLVEKAIPDAEIPADVKGLIMSRFDWDNPPADIPGLVAAELR
jgi:hypothetical protein